MSSTAVNVRDSEPSASRFQGDSDIRDPPLCGVAKAATARRVTASTLSRNAEVLIRPTAMQYSAVALPSLAAKGDFTSASSAKPVLRFTVSCRRIAAASAPASRASCAFCRNLFAAAMAAFISSTVGCGAMSEPSARSELRQRRLRVFAECRANASGPRGGIISADVISPNVCQKVCYLLEDCVQRL